MHSHCVARTTSMTPTIMKHSTVSQVHRACFRSTTSKQHLRRRRVWAQATDGLDGQLEPQQAAALADAMKDPKVRAQMEAMQEAMKSPAVQQQMASMQAMMQNENMMQKMAELKDDPELQPMFEDIKKNGMNAMLKYFNDATLLAKIGSKMGDLPPEVLASAGAIPQPAPEVQQPAGPEINNLLDAAKYGDLEALEDFIAIGKDVNMTDPEGRTPLHYAVAYSQLPIFEELLQGGADIEATDTKKNTPLHYAAGYGRPDFVRKLLERGADGSRQNSSGHTPANLVKMEPRNPIHSDKDIVQLLESAEARS